MIELAFMKELMLIKQVHQKNVIFVTTCIFLNKWLKFQTYACNRCHDLLMPSMNLSNIAILKIENADYRCIISRISKSEAVKLLRNIDLTKKSGTL